MTSRIRLDLKCGQIRDKKTGRFLHAPGLIRIKVSGGILLIPPEPPEPCPPPSKEAVAKWGEWA
jgi:hypothetical protein